MKNEEIKNSDSFIINILNSFSDVNFNINILLHGLILFTILSCLFTFVISNVSTNAFNDEIFHIIKDKLNNKILIDIIKKNSNLSDTILDKLIKHFSKPTKIVEAYNKSLFKNLLCINVLLWIFFITLVMVLKYNCKKDLHIGKIIGENCIIFLFVGIIEITFFFKIALKFIPVKPSFISTQFLQSIKDELSD